MHHWCWPISAGRTAGCALALTTLVLAWPGRHFFSKGFMAPGGAPEMNSLVRRRRRLELFRGGHLRAADAEARRLKQAFGISLALTLPVFVLEMGSHLIPAMHHWVLANIGRQNSWLLQSR